MKEILVFGGTTEGRRIAKTLCSDGFSCTVCVATEYGEKVMEAARGMTIRCGRMDTEQIKEFIKAGDFLAVLDATHPFATEVSENIRRGMKDSAVPYIRVKRDTAHAAGEPGSIRYFADVETCREALLHTEGNILLTTGSKALCRFAIPELRNRLYVRVLPDMQSISACEAQGICAGRIIAMQGPFTVQMNEALLKQYRISTLVTKESGMAGGFPEKAEAAVHTGTELFVIGNPEKAENGCQTEEAIRRIYGLAGKALPERKKRITLIGMGMGGDGSLTLQAKQALYESEIIFGAKRLLKSIPADKERCPYYLAKDVVPRIKSQEKERIAVLFSGDTGCYSGAGRLYRELLREKEEGSLSAEITILPGISSVSFLAARAGVSWEDAAILSIHGRRADVCKAVAENVKTFVLLSGVEDIRNLGRILGENGLEEVEITAGCNLSYPDEKIVRVTPSECMKLEESGLYCCLIQNAQAKGRLMTHGMKDAAFIRGKVPMTKEEIRALSICKLKLTQRAVLYDVGSGTGSVAVECARLSEDIRVFAFEKKPEAVRLLEKNCERFALSNIEIIHKEAPEGMSGLPAPSHVFIGGTGGRLGEILKTLYRQNPSVRIVINAVTLETPGGILEAVKELPVREEEIIQVQVSRAGRAGNYHIMRAENPITICTLQLGEGGREDR